MFLKRDSPILAEQRSQHEGSREARQGVISVRFGCDSGVIGECRGRLIQPSKSGVRMKSGRRKSPRMYKGKVLARAENFLLAGGRSNAWPQQSASELHDYGTFTPKSRRPWWRFW